MARTQRGICLAMFERPIRFLMWRWYSVMNFEVTVDMERRRLQQCGHDLHHGGSSSWTVVAAIVSSARSGRGVADRFLLDKSSPECRTRIRVTRYHSLNAKPVARRSDLAVNGLAAQANGDGRRIMNRRLRERASNECPASRPMGRSLGHERIWGGTRCGGLQ